MSGSAPRADPTFAFQTGSRHGTAIIPGDRQMNAQTAIAEKPGLAPDHDVIVLGAGVTGIYQLYREEGLMVRKRRSRRRAIGTRAPILVEARANARW